MSELPPDSASELPWDDQDSATRPSVDPDSGPIAPDGGPLPSELSDDSTLPPEDGPATVTVKPAYPTARSGAGSGSLTSTSMPANAGDGGFPPQLSERFELIRELGRGGMGVVYLCRDRTLQRMVAIKLILRPSEKLDRLLAQEAQVLASFVHDNIVRLYDYGRANSLPYLVMEFVAGRPLASRLSAGRPSLLESVRLGSEIVSGVQYAHQKGVAHFDLKPANVFLDETGKAKVADFGLAKAVPPEMAGLARGPGASMGGSPGYMPPEQWQGRASFSADVYAIGVILAEMLSGRSLFRGATKDELLRLQRDVPVPLPSIFNRSVPPILDELVHKCLNPDPEKRPALSDVGQILKDWLRKADNPDRRPSAAGFPNHPYRFLDSFGVDDAPIFFGREAESTDLSHLLNAAGVRLVLVFGPCGIGKSSILRAGMARAVDPKRFDLVILLAGPDPALRLRQALLARARAAGITLPGRANLTVEALAAEPRLVDSLLAGLFNATAQTLLLVLDQTEEVFTQNARDSAPGLDFFKLVTQLTESPVAAVKLVIAYRTEFRGEFFPLEQRLGQYAQLFSLGEIDEKGLVSAVEGPSFIEAYRFSYEPGLAERIARDIREASREQATPALPALQIICRQLFDQLQAAGGSVISRELYEKGLGGARGALKRYVEERLASPAYGRQGGMARQILEALTVKEGEGERYARAREEDEVLDFPDRAEGNRALEQLITDRLVVAEAAEGKRVFRLASEVICAVIDGWTAEPDPAQLAARLLGRSFRLWKEHQGASEDLLAGKNLQLVKSQLGGLRGVSDEQRRFVALSLSRERRNRFLSAIAGLAVLASTGGLVYALFFRPGELALNTDPSGATVRLGQQNLGKTPLNWNARPGVYHLNLERKDYQTVDIPVQIRPGGQTSFTQFLPYTRGVLEVLTNPPGAVCTIEHGGQVSVHRSPFTTEFPEGEYAVALALPGYEPHRLAKVKVERNRVITHKVVTLRQKVGWLAARSLREGAHLLVTDPVSGKALLNAPLPLRVPAPLPAGRYRVEATGERGRVDFLSVDITERTTISVSPWIPAVGTFWQLKGVDPANSAAVGDLDSDGIADLVYGTRKGLIHALSGRTGAELWQFATAGSVEDPPQLVDLDRDGVLDAVAASHDRQVYAISGRTGELLWKQGTGDEVQCTPACADLNGDGVPDVVVGSADRQVHAYNGRTGEALWSYRTQGKVYADPILSDVNGDGVSDVIVGSLDRQLYAIDGKTGKRLWSSPGSAELGFSAVRGKVAGEALPDLYLVAADRSLMAVKGRTGERRFRVTPPGGVDGALAAIGDIDSDGFDDLAAISADYQHVMCVSGRTGAVLWSSPFTTHLWPRVTATDLRGDGERQVVVGSPTRIYVLSARTGQPLWGLNLGEVVSAQPTVTDLDGDGVRDLVVAMGSTLAAVPGTLGDHRWAFNAEGAVRFRPALADVNGDGVADALAVAGERALMALDGTTGREIWRHDASATISGEPAVLHNNHVVNFIFGTAGGPVQALSADGKELWSCPVGGTVETRPTCADIDGDGAPEILVGTDARAILALSREGKVLWRRPTDKEVAADLLVTDIDGDGKPEVIAGTFSGQILALSARDGKVLWSFAGAAAVQCPPVAATVGAVRAVVVGMEDGQLVAISTKGQKLWSFRAGSAIRAGPTVLPGTGGSNILVGDRSDNLWLLSGADGSVRWVHHMEQKGAFGLEPACLLDLDGDGSPDPVLAYGGCLYGFDQKSGRELLRTPDRYVGLSHPVLVEGKGAAQVIVASDSAVVMRPIVRAKPAIAPRALWSFSTGYCVSSSPAIGDLTGGGVPSIVVGSLDGYIYALDTQGRKQWMAPAGGRIGPSPALADLGRRGRLDVIVGSEAGRIIATDGASGKVLWSFAAGAPVVSSAAVGDLDGDGAADVVAGTRSGDIFALSGRSGRRLWSHRLAKGIISSPVVADLTVPEADVLAAADDGILRAFRGRDGQALWAVALAERLRSSPVVAGTGNGRLIFVGAGKAICALTAAGKPLWRRTTPAEVDGSPAAADLDGDGIPDAVVGTGDGTVWALSGSNGNPLWGQRTGDRVDGRPAVGWVAGKLTVLVGSRDGLLYAFEGATGKRLWTFGAGSPIGWSSPALWDLNGDGVPDVVVGTQGGTVMAISGQMVPGNARGQPARGSPTFFTANREAPAVPKRK